MSAEKCKNRVDSGKAMTITETERERETKLRLYREKRASRNKSGQLSMFFFIQPI